MQGNAQATLINTTDTLISSKPRLLLSINDLSDDDVDLLLDDAQGLIRTQDIGKEAILNTAILLFLTPSLRTRVGFSVAVHRLGGLPIDVEEYRGGPEMTASESFDDTVRVLTGMTDVLVTRTPFKLDRERLEASAECPIVSGGDGRNEHPTQSLIDLLAIQEERGPVSQLRVGIIGDLSMRSVRSLVLLLDRRLPRELTLISPPQRSGLGMELGVELASRTHWTQEPDLSRLDVLYVAGLPESGEGGTLDGAVRMTYSVSRENLRSLPPSAIILSPLPVIDEIQPDVRDDPRMRIFQQSDRAVFMRMAVLKMLVH